MERAGVPQCCEKCDNLRRFEGSWELYPYDYCGVTGKTIIRIDKAPEWCPKLPEIVKVKEVSRKLTKEEMEEIGKFEAARKSGSSVEQKGWRTGVIKDKGVVILKPRFKDVYESNMENGFRIKLKLNQNQRWYGVFIPGLDYWLVTNRHGVELTMYQRTLEKIFEMKGR